MGHLAGDLHALVGVLATTIYRRFWVICDKTSCQRFEANQARLKMGVLAYHLLHMIR